MSDAWLYLFVGIGLLGLVSAICALIYIRADRDDENTYGAPEGDWRGE